jgi:hypothetical protein
MIFFSRIGHNLFLFDIHFNNKKICAESLDIVAHSLKERIREPEETPIARE